MLWFSRLTLAKKLLATFVSLALITAALGAYGLFNIVSVGGLMDAMYQNNVRAIDHLANAYSRYLVYSRGVTRAPTQSGDALKATRERIKTEHWAKMENAFAAYTDTRLSEKKRHSSPNSMANCEISRPW